jgi:hypothetical protein
MAQLMASYSPLHFAGQGRCRYTHALRCRCAAAGACRCSRRLLQRIVPDITERCKGSKRCLLCCYAAMCCYCVHVRPHSAESCRFPQRAALASSERER